MQQSLAMLAARIVATIAALLHVVFFVFESVLWMRPAVSARFGIATREQAETIRPMARLVSRTPEAGGERILLDIWCSNQDGVEAMVGQASGLFVAPGPAG